MIEGVWVQEFKIVKWKLKIRNYIPRDQRTKNKVFFFSNIDIFTLCDSSYFHYSEVDLRGNRTQLLLLEVNLIKNVKTSGRLP